MERVTAASSIPQENLAYYVHHEEIIILFDRAEVRIGKSSVGFPLCISIAPQVTGIRNSGGADTGARDRREQRYLQRD
jgi:hypothetical protein